MPEQNIPNTKKKILAQSAAPLIDNPAKRQAMRDAIEAARNLIKTLAIDAKYGDVGLIPSWDCPHRTMSHFYLAGNDLIVNRPAEFQSILDTADAVEITAEPGGIVKIDLSYFDTSIIADTPAEGK